MPVTEAEIIEALRPVQDPELHRSIVELDMLRTVSVELPVVKVQIALTIPGCPLKAEIQQWVSAAVTGLEGVERVELDFTSMTDAEREALRVKLHGDPAATAGSQQDHEQGHQRRRLQAMQGVEGLAHRRHQGPRAKFRFAGGAYCHRAVTAPSVTAHRVAPRHWRP